VVKTTKRSLLIAVAAASLIAPIALAQGPNAMVWGHQFGSDRSDYGVSLAPGPGGSVILGGVTYEQPEDSNAAFGDGDGFVVKLDADGAWDWSYRFGTENLDLVHAIATDAQGYTYVTGSTKQVPAGETQTWGSSVDNAELGTYFDSYTGPLGPFPSSITHDIFVTKVSPTGQHVWTAVYGSESHDWGGGIAVDPQGNVFVNGGTRGNLPDAPEIEYEARFLTKFDAAGNRQWTRVSEGSDAGKNSGLVADAHGNIFAAYEGFEFIGLKKYDAQGTELWGRTWGNGDSRIEAKDVVLDADGNAYLIGSKHFYGGVPGGQADGMIAKVDPDGSPIWYKHFGTDTAYEFFEGVDIDADGNLLLSGSVKNDLGEEALVMKIDADGNVIWQQRFASGPESRFNDILVDTDGSLYVAGLSKGPLAGEPLGKKDAVILKLATLPGDTDGDGDIDDADLGTLFANYTGPLADAGGKTLGQGDTDGDGDVDDADLGILFSKYTGPLTLASVPEPASFTLWLTAAALTLTRPNRRGRHRDA